ncbi:gamma-glutamyl hydrolase-like isoform X2 [Leptotrombidium deliense]|uniref:Gamma-glutamyl hydrolase-like isoform X2 n=1 Tax=Leptotrombidium deliense TaxID=299467 RepID=A0A443RZT5_9ACAR|nr:gamma-glutamyl hydrolase-like isoform X2 [Leptotrombidium deliense]
MKLGKQKYFAMRILKSQNVTANYHYFCVTMQDFEKFGSKENLLPISMNHDTNGVNFISMVEAINFPFYGVQFHPEYVIYQFIESMSGIVHSDEAIAVSQYFTRFFVSEARKNNHKFKSKEEENLALIYNYNVTYTGRNNTLRPQTYYFPMNIVPNVLQKQQKMNFIDLL